MVEEIDEFVPIDKLPWKFLHECRLQHLPQGTLAGNGIAAVIINVVATPSGSTSCGVGGAVAALQLRRGANKIQAFARDHYDWFWFWLVLV